MRFCLLPDWYFCCCIEATPSTTNAFLSVLEILDNPESNKQLLFLAYNELKQMDSFMSIYSLPQVLASCRHPNLQGKDNMILKQYFEKLSESLNPTLKSLLERLLEMFLHDNLKSKEILELIQKCSQNILSQSIDRITIFHPYFDLKDFLPETILLAAINNYCSIEENASLRSLLSGKHLEMRIILQNALAHKYGRLAFRLAIRIATLCQFEETKNLLSYIWQNENLSPPIEPDLIHTTFEVLYLKETLVENLNPPKFLKEVRNELLELTWYLSLKRDWEDLVKFGKGTSIKSLNPLKRINQKKKIRDKYFSISLIYWQAILWDFCANVIPQEALYWLAEIWKEPRLFYNSSDPKILVYNTSNEKTTSEIYASHAQLTNLRFARYFVDYIPNQRKAKFPMVFENFIFSPWFEHGKPPNKYKNDQREGYPSAKNPESLLRITATSFTATRLLQYTSSSADDISSSRKKIASLLVHAYDVFNTFRGWLNEHKKTLSISNSSRKNSANQYSKLENLKLTSLVVFGRRQIGLAGKGRFPSISPTLFISILDDALNQETNDFFSSTALPETFISWIADCYLAGADSMSSIHKWLMPELIEKVYKLFLQNLNQHYITNVYEAGLVARFMGKIESLALDKVVNWTENDRQWKTSARQFLLTDYNLPVEDWIRKEWDEDPEAGSAGAVARSIERIAVLSNKKSSDFYLDLAETWKKELASNLEEFSQQLVIDRFIRLRLLEILDIPLLKDSPELQEQITMFLIEHGSEFEIKDLFIRIYPFVSNSIETINTARHDLQNLILKVAKLQVERNIYIQDINDGFAQIRDPYDILIDYRKDTILEEMLARTIFLYSKQFNQNPNDSVEKNAALFIYQTLSELKTQFFEKSKPTFLREVKVDVELSEKGEILIPPTGTDNLLEEWQLQNASFDPNNLRLSINYHNLSTKETICYFDKKKNNPQLISGQIYSVTALLANKRITNSSKSYEYYFSLGISNLLSFSTSRDLDIETGTFVKLPAKYLGGEPDTPIFEIGDLAFEITRLPLDIKKGDVAVFEVKEGFEERSPFFGQKPETIIISQDPLKSIAISTENYKDWEFDTSRHFSDYKMQHTRTVIAELDEIGKWQPIPQGIGDLLLSTFTDEHRFIILTLIREIVSSNGLMAWLLGKKPGENYLIYEHQLLPSAADRLKNIISELRNTGRDCSGLLIVINPILKNEKIILDLYEDSIIDEDVLVLYPKLMTPFDTRNIDWEYSFFSGESLLAKKEDGEWFYYIPQDKQVDGFPVKIKIEYVRKEMPEEFIDGAPFIIEHWKPDTATVRAKYPKHVSLALNSDSEAELYNFISNLQEGSFVELKKPEQGFPPWANGFIYCKTKENLQVNLEVESLTMYPLFQGEELPFETGKIGIIKHKTFERNQLILEVNSDDIPLEAEINNNCWGFLYSIPNSSRSSVYQILWKTNRGAKIAPLEIHFPENDEKYIRKNVLPGSRIRGSYSNGKWSFEIQRLYIQVKALWSSKEFKDIEHTKKSLLYLQKDMTVEYPRQSNVKAVRKESKVSFFEYPKGQLLFLSQEQEREKNIYTEHFGVYRDNQIESQFNFDENTFVVSYIRNRICLRIGNQYVCGELENNSYEKFNAYDKVVIRNIEIRARRFQQEERFELKRVFTLQQLKAVETSRYSAQDIAVMHKILQECIESKLEINASIEKRGRERYASLTVDSKRRSVRIPSDYNEDIWTNQIPILKNESPFIVENEYENNGKVVLSRLPNGKIVASFQEVPPITTVDGLVKQLRLRYDTSYRFTGTKLYYVGKENSKAVESEKNQTLHRFEFGYGLSLLVPESSLRFKGSNFRHANLLLFHGDQIISLSFRKDSNENDDNLPMSNDYNINIEAIKPSFSNVRTIYEQRKLGIVHLLQVTAQKVNNIPQIKVHSVEGFNEFDLTAKPGFFSTSGVKLSSESEKKLLDRYREWELQEPKSFKLYARLDVKHFDNTAGREVLFEHVRLSFEKESGFQSLRDGEYVLLQVNKIGKLSNDYYLHLVPHPEIMHSRDIGADFKEGAWLLRRNFSVREDLLRRIARSESSKIVNKVINQLILVKIKRNRNSSKRGHPEAVLKKLPSRKVSSLTGKIYYDGTTIAVIADISQNEIRLEISPGVYVNLPKKALCSEIESLRKHIKINSVVEITLKGKRFFLRQAAFSDSRYIPLITRPAVTLPLNSLIDENKEYLKDRVTDWRFWKNESFSIGGMPNIVAKAGHYKKDLHKNGVWGEARPNELAKLMREPHPKLIRVGRRENQALICPLEDSFPVGSLEIDENKLSVRIKPHRRGKIKETIKLATWRYLTFGDEPVVSLISRIKDETWSYHDSETGIWTKNGTVERSVVEEHSVTKGPLFFEENAGNLHLRYSQVKFFEFGFPVSDLVDSLVKKTENKGTYYIAGFSISQNDFISSVWIELIPGRLVEIPVKLIRPLVQKGKEHDKININWHSFAPGDLIKLSLLQNDALTIDQFFLEDWQPGIRKALGPQKALLPISEFNRETGALMLGTGIWKITLPENKFDAAQEFCFLMQNNSLVTYKKNRSSEVLSLKNGDVLFLTIIDGRPAFLGLDNWNPVPLSDSRNDWQNTHLGRWIVNVSADYLTFNMTRFASLLEVLGALPVTIERINKESQKIYFSLRHQIDYKTLNSDLINLARIEGLLSDNETVVLRCGSEIFLKSIFEIVMGLPNAFHQELISNLKDSQTLLWLQPNRNGTVSIGLNLNDTNEFAVESIKVIKEDDSSRVGVVVRSITTKKLYWLPQEQTAWAILEYEYLQQLFVNKQFKVKKMPQNYVSIVDLRDIKEEFDKLIIGKEIVVQILKKLDNLENTYLVESFNPQIAFICKSSKDLYLSEAKIVQVWRRFLNPNKIIVVPAGEIPPKLDLPRWMIGERTGVGEFYLKNSLDKKLFDFSQLLFENSEIDSNILLELSPLALEWIESNINEPEINLYLSLIVILVIKDICSHYEQTPHPTDARLVTMLQTWSLRLLEEVGMRAIRSRHVEILTSVLHPSRSYNRSNLSLRLMKLLKEEINGYYSILPDKMDDIKRFCKSVNLRTYNDPDILAISASLQSSIGNENNFLTIFNEDSIIEKLINIYKAIQPSKLSKKQLFLDENLIELIKELYQRITVSSYEKDIFLLSSIRIKT